MTTKNIETVLKKSLICSISKAERDILKKHLLTGETSIFKDLNNLRVMAFRLPNHRSQRSIELFEKAVETYFDKWFDGPSDWINLTADATSYSSTVFDLICDVAISPKLYKRALALGAKPTAKNISAVRQNFYYMKSDEVAKETSSKKKVKCFLRNRLSNIEDDEQLSYYEKYEKAILTLLDYEENTSSSLKKSTSKKAPKKTFSALDDTFSAKTTEEIRAFSALDMERKSDEERIGSLSEKDVGYNTSHDSIGGHEWLFSSHDKKDDPLVGEYGQGKDNVSEYNFEKGTKNLTRKPKETFTSKRTKEKDDLSKWLALSAVLSDDELQKGFYKLSSQKQDVFKRIVLQELLRTYK